ncbi:MAG TPA: DEAD/DEAH box helicase, partial [Candidatus Bathyarchaeia archaeon]|nr:DEAD/DEAH box helicase [Candidatus Bathyarchaeia archaeon]
MALLERKSKRVTREKEFPLETNQPRTWISILTLPPSNPRISTDLEWLDLLPVDSGGLANVLREITQNNHPYEHQEQAINHLSNTSTNDVVSDLIINGGTYSGKSLSFTVPGIVKILTGKMDFFVVFYPSKQLLLDQFDRMKELVIKLEEETGIRLTVKMYSGDINDKTITTHSFSTQKRELYETEQHPPNILLATFDKVWYQLISGKMNPLLEKIQACQYLVFDEIHAFEGFAAAIIKGFVQIHKKINPKSQIILSSATIDNVSNFRDDFLPNAEIITCPPVRGEQEFLGTTKDQTIPLLAELWYGLESLPGKFCLVFLDSKEDIELLTERLCIKLKENQPFFDTETVAMIHADLPYIQRKKVLDEIRKEQKNKIRILLSSSVLELGVNLPNVQTVINIGIPITQKDGIVQRIARNRSKPNERRVNVFIFDLTNPRDNFYWEHKEIIQNILKTNACNPILYPKQNAKILAGLIILHLHYGINDFQEIMNFFLKEGIDTHEIARQQYTKLICFKVLKKLNGKIFFTGEGQNILVQQLKRNNVLVPFSIRAISSDWKIQIVNGFDVNYRERIKQLGKISSSDILKKGLPGNIITRNKQRYLVADIDHLQRNIIVKNHFTKMEEDKIGLFSGNQLFDPTITVGIFPRKIYGIKTINIDFGQLIISRKPKAIAIVNSKLERTDREKQGKTENYTWKELTNEESEELAIIEKVEGVNISIQSNTLEVKEQTNKKLLEIFGKVLLIETETVLSIPTTEFTLVCNTNQLAIYDKGEPNGNTEYLFRYLHKVAEQTVKRLTECSCERGCKQCYGEILGLLPKGSKESLQMLAYNLLKITEKNNLEGNNETRIGIQDNYQEGRIIALSDIHLTSEYCYQEEFFGAISTLSKEADILVINGDLLDKPSEEGKGVFGRLYELALKEGFWSKLVFIRSSTIHDANIEQCTNALYLDYVLVEIPAGDVLFVHGNKIGIDPGKVKASSAEQAAIEAKNRLIQSGRDWLPPINKETHLVIGHLHERFYNERWRVYGLGHWTRKG